MRRRDSTGSGRRLGGLAFALVVSIPACQWISGFEDFEAAQGAAGGGAAGEGATAVGGQGGVSASGGAAGTGPSAAGRAGNAGAGTSGSAGGGGDGGVSGAGARPSLGGEGGAASAGAPAGGALSTAGEAGSAGQGGGAAVAGSAGMAGTAGALLAPGIHGPRMVPYPDAANVRFWIDETEVTRGQYREFLEGLGDNLPEQADYCGWNVSLVPTCAGWGTAGAGGAGGGAGAGAEAGSNDDDANLPVTCVDWCDARAFCAWAGKRLCNESYIPGNDPDRCEWYAVCTSGGDTDYRYPYGSVYERSACRGADLPVAICPTQCWPYPVGDLTWCKTPSGVFDMSGNVAEWVNACNGDDGVIDECRVRGGSYTSDEYDLLCDAEYERYRDDASADLGFRCCAPPL